MAMRQAWRAIARWLALLLLSALALQVYFLARVALMMVLDPQSTTFQRSEAWRLLQDKRRMAWSQQWVDYEGLSPHLKRAVIAAEDAGFAEHSGIEWDALERAWERNQRAGVLVEQANRAIERRRPSGAAGPSGAKAAAPRQPKVVGGSTITQQLAKNLFLDGERSFVRKSQEFVITLMLEAVLSKRRILEIYLNNVEWGEGVFGAQAAARHHLRTDAHRLSPTQAAQLAVLLPAPKRFEKRLASAYIVERAAAISARMGAVHVP